MVTPRAFLMFSGKKSLLLRRHLAQFGLGLARERGLRVVFGDLAVVVAGLGGLAQLLVALDRTVRDLIRPMTDLSLPNYSVPT